MAIWCWVAGGLRGAERSTAMRAWLAVAFCLSVWIHRVEAKLAPPPDSYLLVSSDRTRCLVMRQMTRGSDWGMDNGRLAILPDGRQVDLYTQFPSNGVYQLPDLKPVCFLNWFGRSNQFVLSPNLDLFAWINEFALIKTATRITLGAPSTAIRFFHAGKEIRSYLPADLIETPFVLTLPPDEFSSCIFTAWLGSFQLLKNGELEVITARRVIDLRPVIPYNDFHLDMPDMDISPGNRFVFDLSTGQIISEEHPMRTRAIVVAALLLFGAMFVTGWRLRRKRSTS